MKIDIQVNLLTLSKSEFVTSKYTTIKTQLPISNHSYTIIYKKYRQFDKFDKTTSLREFRKIRYDNG